MKHRPIPLILGAIFYVIVFVALLGLWGIWATCHAFIVVRRVLRRAFSRMVAIIGVEEG